MSILNTFKRTRDINFEEYGGLRAVFIPYQCDYLADQLIFGEAPILKGYISNLQVFENELHIMAAFPEQSLITASRYIWLERARLSLPGLHLVTTRNESQYNYFQKRYIFH